MNMRKPLLLLLGLLAGLTSYAQQATPEHVELLIMEGEQAVFSSEGVGASKKDALEHSRMAVLRKLLYEGVQDYNAGLPIVSSGQTTNIWLREFFEGKTPAYKAFLGDVELIGDFTAMPSGEFSCQTNVVVNLGALLRNARSQGLMEEGEATPAAPQQTPRPAVKKPKTFL